MKRAAWIALAAPPLTQGGSHVPLNLFAAGHTGGGLGPAPQGQAGLPRHSGLPASAASLRRPHGPNPASVSGLRDTPFQERRM